MPAWKQRERKRKGDILTNLHLHSHTLTINPK
jgi:hypothetical protein